MLLADLGAEVIKVERPGIGDIARALEPIISEALKKKTTQERLAEFEPIGMPCGPLNGIADTAVDPLLDSRNIFVDLPLSGDVKGAMRVVKTPMKFSRTQAGPECGAPSLGEHTRELLLSNIGLKPEETASIEHQGIIHSLKNGREK